MRAKDIMTTPVHTVTPETTLKQVAAILVTQRISAVPVVDEEGDLVGIVSEADVVGLQSIDDPRRHLLPGARRAEHPPHLAQDVMTREVVVAGEDEDVTQIARRMLARAVKRVPVVSAGRVTGIISRRDIMKVLARPDAGIEAELQSLLDDEIKMVGWFHVRVDEGVVTLTGPADEASRRLAGLLARSVPGVVEVRFETEQPDDHARGS